jgi:hypothetical protein
MLCREPVFHDIILNFVVVLGRLLIGTAAVLGVLYPGSRAYAQNDSVQVTISKGLISYLGLTAQQQEKIVKLNLQATADKGPQQSVRVHSGIVATLTVDQKGKLSLLESSTGHRDLKTEARGLHILCSPEGSRGGFGGATSKYHTSTHVEPGVNQKSPPPNPPQ